MSKLFFRLLVLLMSLSLIGIILVQVYWFNTSFQNNDEQFKFHVKQVLGKVADKLQKQEAYSFYDKYNHLKDSTGKIPKKDDLLQFTYVQKNLRTNKTIVYSNSIIAEDFNINSSLFDKKIDSERFKNFSSKRVTEVYNNKPLDNSVLGQSLIPDERIEKSGNLDVLDNVQYEIFYKDIASALPIQERVSADNIRDLIKKELEEYGVKTKFAFGIYSNGLATNVKSKDFKFDKEATYSIPILTDNEGNEQYKLLVTFPYKKRFLLSDLVSITILSIIFYIDNCYCIHQCFEPIDSSTSDIRN
jgi:two-component system phosphate regulon sensor histidine kinase PhoR